MPKAVKIFVCTVGAFNRTIGRTTMFMIFVMMGILLLHPPITAFVAVLSLGLGLVLATALPRSARPGPARLVTPRRIDAVRA